MLTEENHPPDYNPPSRYVFPATIIIALVNILIFLRADLTDLFGRENTWITQGALSWQAFFYDHEYYRLLTSMFLHSGIDHIANNMIAFIPFGIYLERRIGSKQFVRIYFLSGILAGCTSMVYNMLQGAYIEAVGASGAIFGIIGAVLVYAIIHRKEPDSLNLIRFTGMIFIAIESGLADRHVDSAAHIGGLLAGILIMLIQKGVRPCRE